MITVAGAGQSLSWPDLPLHTSLTAGVIENEASAKFHFMSDLRALLKGQNHRTSPVFCVLLAQKFYFTVP